MNKSNYPKGFTFIVVWSILKSQFATSTEERTFEFAEVLGRGGSIFLEVSKPEFCFHLQPNSLFIFSFIQGPHMFKVHDKVLSKSLPYNVKPNTEYMLIQSLVNDVIKKMVKCVFLVHYTRDSC